MSVRILSLVAMSVLVFSAHAFGSGDSRCQLPSDSAGARACSDFYDRLDAYREIAAHENGNDDAKSDLDLVIRIQDRTHLNLEYLTDTFVYVLDLVGGSNQTAGAQQVFTQLIDSMTSGESLYRLTTAFARISASENGVDDARSDYSLIISGVAARQTSLDEAVYVFTSLISLEGGSNQTASAQQTFSLLLGSGRQFPLYERLQGYQLISGAENGHDDAISDYRLALLGADRCGSIIQASRNFVEVLNQVGGANNTSQAQDLYRDLYGI